MAEQKQIPAEPGVVIDDSPETKAWLRGMEERRSNVRTRLTYMFAAMFFVIILTGVFWFKDNEAAILGAGTATTYIGYWFGTRNKGA